MRGSHGTFYWNELMTHDVAKAKKGRIVILREPGGAMIGWITPSPQ